MSKFNVIITKVDNSYEIVYNNYDIKDIDIGHDKLSNIINGKNFTISIDESKLKTVLFYILMMS